jgi:hypothetical protein
MASVYIPWELKKLPLIRRSFPETGEQEKIQNPRRERRTPERKNP